MSWYLAVYILHEHFPNIHCFAYIMCSEQRNHHYPDWPWDLLFSSKCCLHSLCGYGSHGNRVFNDWLCLMAISGIPYFRLSAGNSIWNVSSNGQLILLNICIMLLFSVCRRYKIWVLQLLLLLLVSFLRDVAILYWKSSLKPYSAYRSLLVHKIIEVQD